MENKRTKRDQFIDLDAKKLKHIESERKRVLATVMQESPDMLFMCCPRCSRTLEERTVSDISIALCEQCGGRWIDKKSVSKMLRLSGEGIKDLFAML